MLNPDLKYLPIRNPDGTMGEYEHCVFLKHFITRQDIIEVGDYTYYSSSSNELEDARMFEINNVLYAFPGSGAKLEIGRYCQLAHNCKFMLEPANHHINSFTTYPLFWNFIDKHDNYFEVVPDKKYFKTRGKTVLEHDVWIGYDALIMPGVKIGSGAVVGARSVVTKDVAPYTIVAGNPATVIRQRFDSGTIDKLLQIAWWDWEMKDIVSSYDAIMNCDIDQLIKKSKSIG